MNLKVQCLFGLLLFSFYQSGAQSVEQQIEEAYFNLITRQWQLERKLQQQLPPALYSDYQKIVEMPKQDALLPWTYFLEKMRRVENGDQLTEIGTSARQATIMLQKFHVQQLMDANTQSLIDTSQAVRRLQFMAIEEGDKIAEIGFGHGYLLTLLALVYEEVEVYATELDLFRLKGGEALLREDFISERSSNFRFITGHPKSTNLEGQQLDLIIMENVFHHITYQRDFLQSILKSLGPEGEVVIMEEFLESGRDEGNCPERMEKAALERLFSKAGFELLQQTELGGHFRSMLRFGRKTDLHLEK